MDETWPVVEGSVVTGEPNWMDWPHVDWQDIVIKAAFSVITDWILFKIHDFSTVCLLSYLTVCSSIPVAGQLPSLHYQGLSLLVMMNTDF